MYCGTSKKLNETAKDKNNMKHRSFIRGIVLGVLLASVIPYSVKKDKETGTVEVRSLLWGVKKTPRKEGEDRDTYAIAIPSSGLDYADAQTDDTEEEAAETV